MYIRKVVNMDITAVIITKNEEKNIEDCLKSIEWVNEIIIVDAYSTDNTIEICKRYTDHIYQKEWADDFSAQKNYGISIARQEWVFNIDADEIVSDELREEILELSNESEHDYYAVPLRNYFWGRWLKHGGYYPNYKLRLLRKEYAEFHGNIHESIGPDNPDLVGHLAGHLIHNTVSSYERKLEKSNYYSTLSAIEWKKRYLGKWRKRYIIVKPIRTFLIGYVYYRGFMDGIEGLICHIHNAFAEFAVNVKIWEFMKEC